MPLKRRQPYTLKARTHHAPKKVPVIAEVPLTDELKGALRGENDYSGRQRGDRAAVLASLAAKRPSVEQTALLQKTSMMSQCGLTVKQSYDYKPFIFPCECPSMHF